MIQIGTPICVPAPIFIFVNGDRLSQVPACRLVFSIFHYGLCCIWTFFRTSVSTGFIHCTVFAIWTTADFVRWNSCFVQGQRKNSSTLVFSPFHPTSACQILGDCLCTTDALHISNSIRYFWASVCLDAMSVLRVCVCVKSSVCVSKRVRVRGSMR